MERYLAYMDGVEGSMEELDEIDVALAEALTKMHADLEALKIEEYGLLRVGKEWVDGISLRTSQLSQLSDQLREKKRVVEEKTKSAIVSKFFDLDERNQRLEYQCEYIGRGLQIQQIGKLWKEWMQLSSKERYAQIFLVQDDIPPCWIQLNDYMASLEAQLAVCGGTDENRLYQYAYQLADEMERELQRLYYEFTFMGLCDRVEWPRDTMGSHTVIEKEIKGVDLDAFLDGLRWLRKCELLRPQGGSWVIQTLVRPLATSFRYHFVKKRNTNRLDKPEWMFTYITSVMRDNSKFIQEIEQHDIRGHIRKAVFRELVQLIIMKMEKDKEKLLRNHQLVEHYVEECVSFHAEIKTMGYLVDVDPLPLDIMWNDEDSLLAWLEVESATAHAYMSEILHTKALPWEDMFGYDESSVDEVISVHRPARSAERMIRMLKGLTDRFLWVRSPSVRKNVVEYIYQPIIQRYIRSSTRVVDQQRLLPEPDNAIIASITNSLYFLEAILSDWSDQYFFSSAVMEGSTPFQEEILASKEKRKELIVDGRDQMLHAFRKEAAPYLDRRRIWDKMTGGVSSTLSHAIASLRARLHTNAQLLTGKLFGKLWRAVAKGLDDQLTKVLLVSSKHHFYREGVEQLEYDMVSLFRVFSPYTRDPSLYYVGLVDYMRVLRLSALDRKRLKRAIDEPDLLEQLVRDMGLYRVPTAHIPILLDLLVHADTLP